MRRLKRPQNQSVNRQDVETEFEWWCEEFEGLVAARVEDPREELLQDALKTLRQNPGLLRYRSAPKEVWQSGDDGEPIEVRVLSPELAAQLGSRNRLSATSGAATAEVQEYDPTDRHADGYFTSAILQGAVPTFGEIEMGLRATHLFMMEHLRGSQAKPGGAVRNFASVAHYARHCQDVVDVLRSMSKEYAEAAEGFLSKLE